MSNNIIDKNVIEGLKEIGDQEFLTEIIELFLAQSAVIVQDIKGFYSKSDATGLARAAHKLKGSCLNLGAQSLGSICQQIETDGNKNDLSQIEQLVKQVDSIYQETCEELKKLK